MTMAGEIRFISAGEVQGACSMKEAVEAMRHAFAALSDGSAKVPVRTHIGLEDGGDALYMPAYSSRLGRHSVKIASVHPENPSRGLDFVQATVMLFDATTGDPLAILEGKSVTAVRTGAGSGLATDLMAREDSGVVVIFGAGRQAETQLEAVCAVRSIERAYCVSRSTESAERFSAKMSERLDIEVRRAENLSVTLDADVICTATTSNEPILHLKDVRPGTHINAVGTHRPHATEVAPELVAAAHVVVDHRISCMKEAGDVLIPISRGLMTEADIAGELGEVVVGTVAGRGSRDEITLFKSVGNAVQDLYLADLVVRLM